MSNTGQAILTVVGTVVGAYFGYPQLGFALGSLAGQALFPTKLPTVSGPKLSDISQTQSSVGAAVPKGYGTVPATGNIIAKSDAREVIASNSTGKGGPTQTTETPQYFYDFAIGFHDGEILGVRRIWANGKLVYDRRPQQPTESSSSFSQRIAASDILDETMTIYYGTETQLPDPTLEAFYGVGNISAFRGLAYLVFAGWYGKPEDGMKIPLQWRIEYFTSGSQSFTEANEYSNEVLYKWLDDSYPLNLRNDHTFSILGTGFSVPYPGNPYDNVDDAIHDGAIVQGHSAGEMQFLDHGNFTGGTPRAVTGMGGTSAYNGDLQSIVLHYNFQAPVRALSAAQVNKLRTDLGLGLSTCNNYYALFVASGDNSSVLTDEFNFFGSDSTFQVSGTTGGLSPGVIPDGWMGVVDDCFEGGQPYNYITSWNLEITASRVPRAPDNPCAPQGLLPPPKIPGTNNFAVSGGRIVRCGDWTLVAGTFHVLQSYAVSPALKYPLNPCVPLGDVDYNNQQMWEDAYTEAVATGYMAEGLVYGVNYPVVRSSAYTRVVDITTYDVFPVAVSEIVRDLCLTAGYVESDFDVSDLDDQFVIGFVRTGPMAARGAIESLRPFGMFDISEDERKMVFVKRGHGVVDTVNDYDLGASITNNDSSASRLTIGGVMDYDIPRQVRLHYLSYDRDYDAGEADSPVRTDTDAVQTMDLDTTVVLTDEDATKIVQIVWADYWASRVTFKTSLDMSAHKYRTTDCLAIPVDGSFVRARIGAIVDKLPCTRELELVLDDSSSFISYAVPTSPPPEITDSVTVTSPMEMLLLDLPLLRDSDDDAGVYAAAQNLIADSRFSGAVLMRSSDGGGNYARIAQFSSQATMGTVTSPIENADPNIVDYLSSLVVSIPSGMTLENVTLAEMLNGSNAAAIGVDGRWEIVQFMNATQINGTTWQLSGFLRGRRGTEAFVGTSLIDDRFVLLNTALIRVSIDITAVNKEFLYKCVPVNASLDSTDAVTFTDRGVALKPFSPCYVRAYRGLDGKVVITWIRRGRIGQTLQSGVDVALSEDVEDYEVDIYRRGVVVRTISVSTQSATYDDDDEVLDFGSAQSSLDITVYQISVQVGRGTGTAVTVRVPNAAIIPDGFNFMLYEKGPIRYDGGAPVTFEWGIPYSGGYLMMVNFTGTAQARHEPSFSTSMDSSATIASVALDASGTITGAFVIGDKLYVSGRNTSSGRTWVKRVDIPTMSITHTYNSGSATDDFLRASTDGTNIVLLTAGLTGGSDRRILSANNLSVADTDSAGFSFAFNQCADATNIYTFAAGVLKAVNVITAAVSWSTTLNATNETQPADVAVIGGYVYVLFLGADQISRVHRFATTTGTRDSSFSLTNPGQSYTGNGTYLIAHGTLLGLDRQTLAVYDTDLDTTYRA